MDTNQAPTTSSTQKPIGLETYLAAMAAVVPVAFIARSMLSSSSYAAGLENHEQWTPVMKEGVQYLLGLAFWGLLAILSVVWLFTKKAKRRRMSRYVFIGILVVPPAFALLAFFCGRPARDAYLAGFARWTESNVDAPAIRFWLSAKTPVPTTQPMTTPTLPESLAKLTPDSVDLLPAKSGVVLTWGETAEFPSRREVFIGENEHSIAPNVIKWGNNWLEGGVSGWRQAGPGIWISEQ